MADLSTINNLFSNVTSSAQLYNILRSAVDGLLGFGQAEHGNDGQHEILSGPVAARPAAGKAGRMYFATDNLERTLYMDTGTGWYGQRAKTAADVTYTVVAVPAVTTAKAALDDIYARLLVGAAIAATGVNYTFSPAKPILGAAGTVNAALGLLADTIDVLDGSGVDVTYGGSMTLQAALTLIKAALDAFALTTGALGVGFNSTGLHLITTANVQAAMAQLDAAVFAVHSTHAALTTTYPGVGYFAAAANVKAALDLVGADLAAMPSWSTHNVTDPSATITVGVKLQKVMNRAAIVDTTRLHMATAPIGSDAIVAVTKNGASMFTTVVPAGSTTGLNNADHADFVDGDILGIQTTQVGSGTPGSNLKISWMEKFTIDLT